jgi:phosphosulfolactate synthase (CoM biosynthesis protein A)
MDTKYMQGFDDFITEGVIKNKGELQELSTPDQIWRIIRSKADFGVISAFDYKQDAEKNHERYRQLAEELDKLGLEYIEFSTGYMIIDSGEQSIRSEQMFFVKDIAHGTIKGLGKKYNQETVIFGNSERVTTINIRNEGSELALSISGMLMSWVIVLMNPGTFPPPQISL